MQDELIPLFEDYKIAKEMMKALQAKYSAKYQTHVQLLLEKINGIYTKEGNDAVNHGNNMTLLAKELSFLSNTITNKMQVSMVLNSLPPSWDLVVTSLFKSSFDYGQFSINFSAETRKKESRKRLKLDDDGGFSEAF